MIVVRINSRGPRPATLDTTVRLSMSVQNGEISLLHGLDKKLTTLDAPKQIMGGCIHSAKT